MGEKKKKEAKMARWKQVVVIGACVLFVVLMIVSSMGSSWITGIAGAKPGNTVVVDYTINDAAGNPVITTDQQLFKQIAGSNGNILYTNQLSITANMTRDETLLPIPAYSATEGWKYEYALFAPEFNAISSGVVGMKVNEQKKVTVPGSSSMVQLWTPEQLALNGVNMSQIQVGDSFVMGVSDNPDEMATNSSAETYVRIGAITNKAADGVTVNFGVPTIDLKVVSIGS